MVDFPSPGAALVTSSDRIRRSKSESRIELRSVRMASSKPRHGVIGVRRSISAVDFPLDGRRTQAARQVFTTGSVPITSVFERPRHLLGIADRVVEHVADQRHADRHQRREQERQGAGSASCSGTPA